MVGNTSLFTDLIHNNVNIFFRFFQIRKGNFLCTHVSTKQLEVEMPHLKLSTFWNGELRLRAKLQKSVYHSESVHHSALFGNKLMNKWKGHLNFYTISMDAINLKVARLKKLKFLRLQRSSNVELILKTDLEHAQILILSSILQGILLTDFKAG